MAPRTTDQLGVSAHTHDGIGVVDATLKDEATPGPLSETAADAWFDAAAEDTSGHSRRTSILPLFAPRPHQTNATFLDVLDGRPELLVALRAVPLFLPGSPRAAVSWSGSGQAQTVACRAEGGNAERGRLSRAAPAGVGTCQTGYLTLSYSAFVAVCASLSACAGVLAPLSADVTALPRLSLICWPTGDMPVLTVLARMS